MPSSESRLRELQEEYARTKYNKATDKYLGILRAKIAKAKKEMNERKKQKGTGYAVKKSGDATVVLVGPPNVGKSSLLSKLTNANSKVAGYAFTTVEVIPGMLNYNGAHIQILDLPGLIEGAHMGRGGGRKIASIIRIADMVLFVVDPSTYKIIPDMVAELSSLGIIVNRGQKRIKIERLRGGGISVEANGHSVPQIRDIREILGSFGIYNASISFFDNAESDDIISMLSNSSVYIKGMIVLNKIDTTDNTEAIMRELQKSGMSVIEVSAQEGRNINALKEAIFSHLGLMRIYLKPRFGEADMEKPFILKSGSTVADAAKKLHNKKLSEAKYAYVSGASVKFASQKVGMDHVLKDGDIVTFI